MADTKLKSVELRNWMTVRAAAIEFPERGVVLVRGQNLTAQGKMESIGSGKTSLGEAISRTLLGVPGRYALLGHYSPNGAGDTYLKVVCEHKGKELVVELGYKAPELSKTGEGFRFTYDGQQVWRDNLRNTRDDLACALTVPTDLAAWTVYLDGDRLKFDNLSQRNSVDLLMSALAQPPWTDFHQKASNAASKFKTDLAADRSANAQARQHLENATLDLDTATHAFTRTKNVYETAVKENNTRLEAARKHLVVQTGKLTDQGKQMSALKKQIDAAVAANAKQEHALEMERNRCNDEVQALLEDRTEKVSMLSVAKTTQLSADNELARMLSKPKDCPTCGKPWDKGHSESELAAQKERLQELKTNRHKAEAVVANVDQKIAAARSVAGETSQRLANLRAKSAVSRLSEQYEGLEAEEERLQDAVAQLKEDVDALKHGPDRSDFTRAEALFLERKMQLDKAAQNLEATASKLAETEEAVQIVNYWYQGFGPTGIPNMILKDAIAPLNETARRISTLMTGGAIHVHYDTSRALVTGREKAELIITVKNVSGAQRFEGSSKGEGSLTNLIIAETLAEVGQVAGRIGYRFYDEIAVNQDSTVRRSIFSYLSEVAQRYGILVFLVSHAPEAANYADYVLIAEKSDKGTVYRWA